MGFYTNQEKLRDVMELYSQLWFLALKAIEKLPAGERSKLEAQLYELRAAVQNF